MSEPAAGTVRVADIPDGVTYDQAGPGTFTTNMGVVLKLKRFPAELLSYATKRLEQPKPPRTFNESDRKWTVHDDDPDYLDAYAKWTEAYGDLQFRVIVLAGTEIQEVPEGVWPPDSDEWVAWVARITGNPDFMPVVAPIEDRDRRYLDWLLYYVLGNGEISALEREVGKVRGRVLEADVSAAQDSFRRAPRRASPS